MQIFIASVSQDGRAPNDLRYVELRAKIQKLALPGFKPWIAEFAEPKLHLRGWRAIVDSCVHALHASDLMIVLLFRRLGTAIEIDALGPSPVSHLEIELFHAGLRRIPVLFFQAKDFEPDPQLAAFLGLIKRITPPECWMECPEQEIATRVISTLRAISADGVLPSRLQGLCDALSEQRSFERVDQEVSSCRLSFLRDFAPGSNGKVSIDRVDLLLAETESLAGTGENAFVDRLSRLWLALRDLAQCPVDQLDAELAMRWVHLCELWTSSAAWLHLHGPLELGVLATLHTRVDLRNAGFLPEREFPFGAFASEAYSIAKVSDTKVWQRRRFRAACALATRQIEHSDADPSGAFGIRASAAMQLAQRGAPWLAVAGLADYRRMVRTRERLRTSESQIGEAYVELGFAEFAIGGALPWLRRKGLDRMRDGVAMLERDQPELRAGFLKRAKLKLAQALESAGALDEAQAQRTQLEAFARAQGLPVD